MFYFEISWHRVRGPIGSCPWGPLQLGISALAAASTTSSEPPSRGICIRNLWYKLFRSVPSLLCATIVVCSAYPFVQSVSYLRRTALLQFSLAQSLPAFITTWLRRLDRHTKAIDCRVIEEGATIVEDTGPGLRDCSTFQDLVPVLAS